MNRMKLKTLALAALLVSAIAGSALAETTYGVVHDSSGTVVRNTYGNCVRTHWQDSTDACPGHATISQEDRTVYFEFGKATLTKESKAHLNALVAKVKAAGDALGAQVVGYADRIGKPAANEKLSRRRADAVRDYLMAHGLITDKITKTRWLGATEPTTDCPNNLPKQRLIQCLQNDRRVEVEIVYDP